jgi:hypothetical protein
MSVESTWLSWFVRSRSAVEHLEGEYWDELGSLLSVRQLYGSWLLWRSVSADVMMTGVQLGTSVPDALADDG